MIAAKCELVDQTELNQYQPVVVDRRFGQGFEGDAGEEGSVGIAEGVGHTAAVVGAEELAGNVGVVAVQELVLVLASWPELA